MPKVNILCDGIIAIKNSTEPRSIHLLMTDWLNLSPKNREILLPYIKQFSKHQLLTQKLFVKLISFSALINSLPVTCSLQDIPESLITKAAFEKLHDFFVTMDSATTGCPIILQDYLQEISDSKDVVVNKYFKGEETSAYEYRALKLFSTDNPFPRPTGSATDEESENDELAVDLGF